MIDYKRYRDDRYIQWGNSGAGSYWDNASFKADYLNKIIEDKTVIEVWCGDGNNLSLYKGYKSYLGLDVSQKAIDICKEMLPELEFGLFDYSKRSADVVLCLDVTYHIFPRKEWEQVIDYCYDTATDFVVFYSFLSPDGHAKHINDYNLKQYLIDKWRNFYIDTENVPPNSQSRFITIKK